ncbi:unnamed protein product [Clonostachys solani]|uniref:Uncharacterized protein n=1 Tax=Clonostachys solani TaxID=160281 RepID=A0A9N9Z434_9HYPO|nr:unnamed protein product [Clonostachys solani]
MTGYCAERAAPTVADREYSTGAQCSADQHCLWTRLLAKLLLLASFQPNLLPLPHHSGSAPLRHVYRQKVGTSLLRPTSAATDGLQILLVIPHRAKATWTFPANRPKFEGRGRVSTGSVGGPTSELMPIPTDRLVRGREPSPVSRSALAWNRHKESSQKVKSIQIPETGCRNNP